LLRDLWALRPRGLAREQVERTNQLIRFCNTRIVCSHTLSMKALFPATLLSSQELQGAVLVKLFTSRYDSP